MVPWADTHCRNSYAFCLYGWNYCHQAGGLDGSQLMGMDTKEEGRRACRVAATRATRTHCTPQPDLAAESSERRHGTSGNLHVLTLCEFVFVDEKTFKAGEVKEHIGEYGYAAKGFRVPMRYAIDLFLPV